MSEETKSCSLPENAEPTATNSTVPMWIFVAMLVLIFLGFVFFDHHSGWFSAKVYSPYDSPEQLEAYQPKSGAQAVFALGKVKFEQNCGICHGMDGMGKPGTSPPLAGSEWVITKGYHRLTMIPLEGLNGPIEVKGQVMNFSAGMVAIGGGMTDSDLAAVLTYIRGSWGNQGGEVTADDVKAVRASVGAHPAPLAGDQLKTTPE
jgi:mono/diheme cytochrome c family protein